VRLTSPARALDSPFGQSVSRTIRHRRMQREQVASDSIDRQIDQEGRKAGGDSKQLDNSAHPIHPSTHSSVIIHSQSTNQPASIDPISSSQLIPNPYCTHLPP
jgi:hypothetical protein